MPEVMTPPIITLGRGLSHGETRAGKKNQANQFHRTESRTTHEQGWRTRTKLWLGTLRAWEREGQIRKEQSRWKMGTAPAWTGGDAKGKS